jgi:YbbR domain-containing protein
MRRFRGLLFHNFGWKLLSLAVAVLLWTLVATEPEHETAFTVRLLYKDLPDDLEFSSEPVSSVSLELRGPLGELGELGSLAHPTVVLDMSIAEVGERTFPITQENVKLPRGVMLVRAIPSEVRFAFEKRFARSVPVVARFSGDGQHGYSIVQKTVTPPELTIVGPASRVARISSVFTDPVEVSAVVDSAVFRVNAFVDDPYVRFQSSPQVTVAVMMKKIN